MRILLVANYVETKGGISLVVKNLFEGISKDGYITEIFSTKCRFFRRAIIYVPLFFKARKFDVVHLHGCSGLGFFPILIGIIFCKFFLGKKTIVTYHGGGAELFLKKYHLLIRPLLLEADSVTVMSEYFYRIFDNYKIKTIIIPNVINLEISNKRIDFSYPRIISVRALTKIYNIDDILYAFKIIQAKFKKAELKILNQGPETASLKKLATNLKLSNTRFIGSIPNSTINNEMLRSNIMISVPIVDNQPMSVLESFASGIPVISSNIGGIPCLIRDHFNGFLVNVHNPDQIFEKVDWIISNPVETEKITRNAKESLDQFKWDKIKPLLLNLYNN